MESWKEFTYGTTHTMFPPLFDCAWLMACCSQALKLS